MTGKDHKTIIFTSIGECMVELMPTTCEHGFSSCFNQSFAGDTLNTAVYLSRLLQQQPVTVKYVTSIGDDPFSDAMECFWLREKIDCQYVTRITGKLPGLYLINTDGEGERTFSYWRENSAAKFMFSEQGISDEQMKKIAMECDYLYLSGISLAVLDETGKQRLIKLLSMTKENTGKVVFDSNYRPELWQSKDKATKLQKQILSFVDIALLTFEDESRLHGDNSVNNTLKRYEHVPEVVIKQGASGCVVKAQGIEKNIPSEKITHIVDTTAAGDAFNAAYLASRLAGIKEDKSVQFAHRLAGRVIQENGAIISKTSMQTSIEEIQSLWIA